MIIPDKNTLFRVTLYLLLIGPGSLRDGNLNKTIKYQKSREMSKLKVKELQRKDDLYSSMDQPSSYLPLHKDKETRPPVDLNLCSKSVRSTL